MHKYILLTVLLIQCFHSHSQNNHYDSLWTNWTNTSLNDSIRFSSLLELENQLIDNGAQDSVLQLSKLHLKEANRLNNIKEKVNAYSIVGDAWFIKGQYDSTEFYHLKALEIARKIHHTKGIQQSAFRLGSINRTRENLDLAMQYYNESLSASKELNNPRGIAMYYNVRSNIHRDAGNLDSALFYNKICLDIAKENTLNKQIAQYQLSYGILLKYQGNYEEAIRQFQAANSTGMQLDNELIQGQAFTQIGDMQQRLGQEEAALTSLEKGESLARSIQHNELLFNCLYKKALLLGKLSRYEERSSCLEELKEISAGFGTPSKYVGVKKQLFEDFKRAKDYDGLLIEVNELEEYLAEKGMEKNYAVLLTNKAVALLNTNQLPQALEYAKESLALNQKRKNPAAQASSLVTLISVHEALGNYKEAFDLQHRVTEINHEIYTDENKNAILKAEIRQKFETEALQDSLEFAFKEERLQAENTTQKQVSILAVVGVIILGLLSVFLFLSRKTIVKQQKQITRSLEEKETLLREIHHRVKNNLQVVSSLLRLQIRVTNDDKVKKALNEGQARIESMSLIHQSLYQKENLASIQMKSYLEKLTKSIFNTYRVSNNDVQLHLEIEDFNLSIDTVVPIGLIINELITNSLKYAFESKSSGEIWVSLVKRTDSLFLQVKDNGIGFSKEILEKEKNKSFGFTLIDAFTKKLDAELSIRNQNGAVVSLTIRNFKSIG